MIPRVFRNLSEARGRFGPSALAIGNFDGVHIGHQKLIQEAVDCARENSLVPAVLTFNPHPTAVIAPRRVPPLICSLAKRFEWIGLAGAERIFLLHFTAQVARLSPEEFVSEILVDALDTKAVFVGENFRFGYQQTGTPAVFENLGKTFGFKTHFLKPVTYRNDIVSSTAVRTQLSESQVVRAARLLGRCYSIDGPVVSGRGIGSKQTVPTLNLRPASELIVPRGIFVTETLDLDNGRHWPSVTSCGHNPTFGATELTVETYLLAPLEGASPKNIEVRFRHFLRPEETYPDAAALKAQIMKDVARAQAYWRHADRLATPVPSVY
ncbi:MAG TPA: riboflavin biosynthesis protein RibF [Bryobacteraceae bacterium]|nr:riboflavin biosynthesis protein RibF [Bryobacteraceae bacterium]